MDLINPKMVTERIEQYFQNHPLDYLTSRQAQAAAPFLRHEARHAFAYQMRDRLSALTREQFSKLDPECADNDCEPRNLFVTNK